MTDGAGGLPSWVLESSDEVEPPRRMPETPPTPPRRAPVVAWVVVAALVGGALVAGLRAVRTEADRRAAVRAAELNVAAAPQWADYVGDACTAVAATTPAVAAAHAATMTALAQDQPDPAQLSAALADQARTYGTWATAFDEALDNSLPPDAPGATEAVDRTHERVRSGVRRLEALTRRLPADAQGPDGPSLVNEDARRLASIIDHVDLAHHRDEGLPAYQALGDGIDTAPSCTAVRDVLQAAG